MSMNDVNGLVDLPLPAVSARVEALRIDRGQSMARPETLAEEIPVALVFNGISHAVMMASPLDLEDFALGFSLTEGIIARPGELLDLEVVPLPTGVQVEMRIPEQRFAALKEQRRNLTGRTGCGLCGQDSLQHVIRPLSPVSTGAQVLFTDVLTAMDQLGALQPLNLATGAAHAAGWWYDGRITVREDIGRHNALDKLIGAVAHQPVRDGVLVISSRASYEMVHKAAAAGFAVLAAISAPTALAVRLAEETGLTLAGFVRGERLTVYSHPDRILR
ncbi:formate dehydrogenase accessory sulfurtransferase FdhD [Silvimonas amylolytica]|uniref:Sulfur carrier protein FdhD n=1 Tax=Silvimonas amylolytica TaxID=449663 RepID=A0ABQ2PKU6_9NEIS|nr:formate dehydrogenase accessory sulfurtransferase FdhD [Silvimonas amylolytica]GGP26255.1 sulfurtransferase FdhD [Silvimonas amylolytica]